MKVIFAKYNRERLPQFQVVTKIVEDTKGGRFAIKEALTSEAIAHVNIIGKYYENLKNAYPNADFAIPTVVEKRVEFAIVKGDLFELLLIRALDDKDIEQFFRLVDQYACYLDSFVSQKAVQFEPSIEFKAVLGKCDIKHPQDVFNFANIDLIFSNLFLHEGKMTQIDYEWVFSFPIPKKFIFWRALTLFFEFQGLKYSFISLKQVLTHYGFSESDQACFGKMENSFQRYVNGPILSALYLKPTYSLLSLSQGSHVLRVFSVIRFYIKPRTYLRKVKNWFSRGNYG